MTQTFRDKRFCTWCGGRLEQKADYLTCTQCGANDYNTPRTAVAVLVISMQGDMLLARRAHDPGKGKLDVPGGFIDGNETPHQAAVRELNEETGLQIAQQDLTLSDAMAHGYLFQGKQYPLVALLFTVHVAETSVTAADDVASLEWVRPENIDFSAFAWSEQADCIKSYLHAKNML